MLDLKRNNYNMEKKFLKNISNNDKNINPECGDAS